MGLLKTSVILHEQQRCHLDLQEEYLPLERPSKAQPDIGFFRNTGLALVALTLLAGTIAAGMTFIGF